MYLLYHKYISRGLGITYTNDKIWCNASLLTTTEGKQDTENQDNVTRI